MNVALLLSGGTGTRLGADIPKQYIKVGGKPVMAYCLEAICRHSMIDAVQIVAGSEWHEFILGMDMSDKFKGFSPPGANRQLSIYNGLSGILEYAGDNDYVFIHDAARPLLSSAMITNCLSAAHNHDGVLPVLPMKDTVYLSRDGSSVSELLPREKVYAGQAPETFVLGKYYEANRALFPDRIRSINGSTEPAVLAGMDIVMTEGDENNFKITTKADLERFEEMVKSGRIK